MAQWRFLLVAALLAAVAACGTRSSSSVTPVTSATPTAPPVAAEKKDPSSVQIYETDVTDHKYRTLGDISVTVSKWSIFDDDPTPAKVNEALRKRAAEMGADAVVLVRYGTVGISLLSWGSLDGNGRAVVFEK
jgi:hypothetical protein